MEAIIRVDVPEWQIGQVVSVYFPDSMVKYGLCLKEDEDIQFNDPLVSSNHDKAMNRSSTDNNT